MAKVMTFAELSSSEVAKSGMDARRCVCLRLVTPASGYHISSYAPSGASSTRLLTSLTMAPTAYTLSFRNPNSFDVIVYVGEHDMTVAAGTTAEWSGSVHVGEVRTWRAEGAGGSTGGSVTITGNMTVDIGTIVPASFDVTITNNSGVAITIGYTLADSAETGQLSTLTIAAGASGTVEATHGQTLSWEASASGYVTQSGSIEVTADVNVQIQLVPVSEVSIPVYVEFESGGHRSISFQWKYAGESAWTTIIIQNEETGYISAYPGRTIVWEAYYSSSLVDSGEYAVTSGSQLGISIYVTQ